jgi:hypothetical protein
MTAPISLPRRLPAHAKLRGDFWPADPEADGAVDERVKLSLCSVPRRPGALDSFQDLSRGSPGRRLSRALAVQRSLVCLDGPRLLGLLYRSAPRFAHSVNDARLTTMRVSAPNRPEACRGHDQAAVWAARRGRMQCDAHHIIARPQSLAVVGGRLRSVAYISDSAIRGTGICIAAAIVAQ